MTRNLAYLALGMALNLPLWFAASWIIDRDVHDELRDCRASLSALVEGRP